MPDYLIRWETGHEAATAREAAELAWRDRSAPGSIANVFTVVDPAAGVQVTVDLSEPPEPPRPRPQGRVFEYASKVEVTLKVIADTEEAAFALLDEVFLEVTAGGEPVRTGLIGVSMQVDGDPELLPDLNEDPVDADPVAA
ncbi:MAG: hypothetical protein JWN00_3152 [Actinomycetia bacterium]|nr:hypothetical protein [Actinomycetes bacterium]